MYYPKFKKESYKKRFFRPDNRLLRIAKSIINKLDGTTNEEKLGQFETFIRSELFQRKFPEEHLKNDVITIVRLELSDY